MSPNETGFYPGGWRKARRSMGNGECVEVAPTAGRLLVRDSKIPNSATLAYPVSAWQLFVASTKAGKFDTRRSLYSFRYEARGRSISATRTIV
jgi:Domain of unknown function (DUF397)